MSTKALAKISKKGVSGKILTMIVSLIIAIAALILLWGFLQEAYPLIVEQVKNMISGFKEMVCEMVWGEHLCGAGKWIGDIFG